MENIIQTIPMVMSSVLLLVAVLVAVTNIITQVLKGVLPERLPTNVLAMVVAMVVTLVAYFALIQAKGFPFEWYMLAAAVVVGFMVAYAAMYSFDKLRQVLESINKWDTPEDP